MEHLELCVKNVDKAVLNANPSQYANNADHPYFYISPLLPAYLLKLANHSLTSIHQSPNQNVCNALHPVSPAQTNPKTAHNVRQVTSYPQPLPLPNMNVLMYARMVTTKKMEDVLCVGMDVLDVGVMGYVCNVGLECCMFMGWVMPDV